MINTVTINNIIDLFRSISTRHLMIKDFGYGPTYKIDNDRDIQYPLLWLDTPTSSVQIGAANNMIGFYNIELYCMDRADKDDINFEDSISDTDFILNAILTELIKDDFYIENQVKVDGNIQKELSLYDGKDDVIGWKCTFSLKFPIKYTECTIPATMRTS